MATTEANTRAAPAQRAETLLTMLAERVGARVGASTVFGTPVERDGITVVPVAVARFGFGGGAGADPDTAQEGAGGGAGGMVTATGYIEIKDGRSRFVPIVHPGRVLALVLTAAVAGLLIARPLTRTRRMPPLPWR